MIYLIGTNIRKGCPPFCTPFHFHTSRVEKPKFSTFSRSDPIFLGAQMALPPLFEFLESPKHDLQILYVSFFVKMCCFCSTDPCHKNESAILLCIAIEVDHFLPRKEKSTFLFVESTFDYENARIVTSSRNSELDMLAMHRALKTEHDLFLAAANDSDRVYPLLLHI